MGIKDGYHLDRCLDCTLVQITDDLSELSFQNLYDKEFFTEAYSWQHDEKGKKIAYDKFHYRFDEIEKYRPEKGRMFEIGCAFGLFLDAARSRGWAPTGVELWNTLAAMPGTN